MVTPEMATFNLLFLKTSRPIACAINDGARGPYIYDVPVRTIGCRGLVQNYTASLSHLRTVLPESSSRPFPYKRPNHAT